MSRQYRIWKKNTIKRSFSNNLPAKSGQFDSFNYADKKACWQNKLTEYKITGQTIVNPFKWLL